MEKSLQNLLDELAFLLEKHPILAKISKDKQKMALLKRLKNGGIDEEEVRNIFSRDYDVLIKEGIISRIQSGGGWTVILGFEGLRFLEVYERVGSII